MSEDRTALEPIIERLTGQQLLVTGSTGFLAKAFIEKMLRDVPTIGGIHLLVRDRPGGIPARKRVDRDVLGHRAFDRLRAALGDRFDRLGREKVHVVGGDLTKERLGLTEKDYQALTRSITLIVNSAATVTFDERLDDAVALNTLGPRRLLQFAHDAGALPMLHVSTAYVCGAREGLVLEDFSAPPQARALLPKSQADSSPVPYDLDALLGQLNGEITRIISAHGPDTEVGRRMLIETGMTIARRFGWNDTYTFTKWIGEQLLVRDRDRVPLVIFRPAIIESSYEEPEPGWIDGLRMADPLIVAYGRGKLREFPGRGELPLDLIPVDLVANAMIAALPAGSLRRDGVKLYQCASSGRHPLRIRQVVSAMHRAFQHRPMNGEDGRPVYPPTLRLLDRDRFVRRWESRGNRALRMRKWLERRGWFRRETRRLANAARQIEQLIYFAKIYSPYTHLDCRFADDALIQLHDALNQGDRKRFPFDVAVVDWNDYIINRHVPGLRSFVLGTGSEPSRRLRDAGAADRSVADLARQALQQDNLFQVFAYAASRLPEKPALQIRRGTRWTRYTYDQVLRATATIGRRFEELGLRPGDRVALCGENSPEWALVYLAIMRSGMTAVPLDPQTQPDDVWASCRFAGVQLLCAGSSTVQAIRNARRDGDVEVVTTAAPFVPPPGASRDAETPPVHVPGTMIASILFTSGTTVMAKAVPLTHRNFIANARALIDVHPVAVDDEFLSVLPMYHAFEFTGGFLAPLAGGATITYLEQVKGANIRAAMNATGTTVMLVVPRLLRLLHDSIVTGVSARAAPKRWMFRLAGWFSNWMGPRFAPYWFASVHRAFGGRLRMFVCGGSRLDPDLFLNLTRLGFKVYEGYGLTETAPVLTVNPPGASKAGSVGTVLPNVELEVRNRNLEGIGEVWVRGPNVMTGYLDHPVASAEVLADGWLRTGDLGRLDEDGYLHLTGRTKDLIITGAGKNVYPDEVELKYADLPYVKELCVFGMPAPDGMGDAVHAVIVLDRDGNPELDPSSMERAVRVATEHVSEGFPSHQRIAVLHFWERELPKTSTLKAKRGLVRRLVEGAEYLPRGTSARDDASTADQPPPLIDNPAALSAVRTILARVSRRPEESIQPSMHLLLDLGIDSIGKIDVLGSLESLFDLRVDEERAALVTRVADLIHLVGSRRPQALAERSVRRWRLQTAEMDRQATVNGHLPAPLRPVRWLVRGGVLAFMSTYVRVQAHGREHLPRSGPFILAPNHSSHLDSPSVLAAVGRLRRVWIAGAEDYFFNTRVKRFIFGKLLDTIAFDRQADGVRGLRRSGEALRRGDGLLIYPEGTRSLTGEIQPFKVGVAVLSAEHGAPIVPVYVDGTFDLFRKGSKLVRPGTVTVSFGAPVPAPVLADDDDQFSVFHNITTRVQAAVVDMRNQSVQADDPPDRPWVHEVPCADTTQGSKTGDGARTG